MPHIVVGSWLPLTRRGPETVLTYWVALYRYDSDVYNIRRRTRREVRTALRDCDPDDFTAPRKVSVEYRGGFDLMTKCSYEDRMWWEGFSGDARDREGA